jgi:hypothetical protein
LHLRGALRPGHLEEFALAAEVGDVVELQRSRNEVPQEGLEVFVRFVFVALIAHPFMG